MTLTIKSLIDESEQFEPLPEDVVSARRLFCRAVEECSFDSGLILAALFDLLVGLEYYRYVSNTGWTYCNKEPYTLFYPYVNVCPKCLNDGNFVYTEGKKPSSGSIGKVTTNVLLLLLLIYFEKNERNIKLYRAKEPVDVIIYDVNRDIAVLAEVKASPLVTLPLALRCDEQTEYIDGERVALEHSLIDCPFWNKNIVNLYIPQVSGFDSKLYPVNFSQSQEQYSVSEALDSLLDPLLNLSFIRHYLEFWKVAFRSYGERDVNEASFWLTNACGSPTPPPPTWPRRKTRGGGYETISDLKSSVGMDRTDDIKKGVYQILKLGAEFKPRLGKEHIKTALISNIHAVRHYEDYFLSLRDIVWLIDKEQNVENVSDIPLNTSIYNLFDGIIAFTRSEIRDQSLRTLFDF